VDLHWLFLHARPAWLKDPRFKDLFGAEEFDFEVAWNIARKTGATETIIGHLNLPIETQICLAVLRSGDARDALSFAERDAEKLAARLRQSRQAKYLALADDWRNVRFAYGIVNASINHGQSTPIQPTPRQVAPTYRLMTGRIITDKAVGKKLDSIRRWTSM
jgi:hypothetical protein